MSLKRLLFHVCVSSLAIAQTQLQIDTLRTQLQSIQDKAASSFKDSGEPTRPLNWKELVDADAVGMQSLGGPDTHHLIPGNHPFNMPSLSGTSLQAALDLAQPGDTLVLEAGAEYKGNFILRQ